MMKITKKQRNIGIGIALVTVAGIIIYRVTRPKENKSSATGTLYRAGTANTRCGALTIEDCQHQCENAGGEIGEINGIPYCIGHVQGMFGVGTVARRRR